MAITASDRRVMLRLISMACEARFARRDLPLMRDMAHRARRRRMCRFQMQLGALRMTARAIRRRLNALLHEMTSRAGERRHRRIRRTHMTCRAFWGERAPARMAGVAGELRVLAHER